LFASLDVDSIAEVCLAIENLTAQALLELLIESGITLSVALEILTCLGFDVDLIDLDIL